MTLVTPYQLGFERDDSLLTPGAIFRKLDGSLWKVNPNGSQSPLTSGGGGAWGEASTAQFSGSGSPVGSVTPNGEGDLYVDETTPALYQATGLTSADWSQVGGGGSQPGALASVDFLFTERATAGTYTATLAMLEGSSLIDILVYPLAVWAADAAALNADDNNGGYLSGVSLDANSASLTSAYDPTSVFAPPDGNYTTLGISGTSGLYRSDALVQDVIDNTNKRPGPGRRYQADDVLTVTVVTTIAVPPVVPVGLTVVKVVYFTPVTAIVPSFA